MAFRNQAQFHQELFTPDLPFEDKELSTFFFVRNYRYIDLSGFETSKDFLTHILTFEKIASLCNYYLNTIENSRKTEFEALKHDKGFDINEVLDSLCEALQDDSKLKDFLFDLQKRKYSEEFSGTDNPLEAIFYEPYVKYFCDALSLTFTEATLFIIGMINNEWNWLFPEQKSEEYKAQLLCSICNAKRKSPVIYVRKLNRKLMQLGLFSSPWTVNKYVYSFFKNETVTYSLTRCTPNLSKDIYDYDEVSKINNDDFEILFKLTDECCKKTKGSWQIVNSNSDFRNKNYLTSEFEKHGYKVYELQQDFALSTETELAFYILSLSIQLTGKKAVIFISNEQAQKLLQIEDSSFSRTFLKNVKIPVIMSVENLTENDRKKFLENGINPLYTLELKVPEKSFYHDKALNYFCEKKVPEHLISAALDCSESLKLSPEKWDEVTGLLQTASSLTKEQACNLMENHFAATRTRSKEKQKNSHYSLEALNTTESLTELAAALKNAEEEIACDYCDSGSQGVKTLLYGISGGGKTAYVKELSKMLDRPLKIIHPSDILSPYVGETEQNISRLFKQAAKDNAILLIDEADSFLHPRGDNVNHHNDSKVNSFLIEIERFPGILFCNTNLPENLDKALDRRFNFKIGFKPLTKEGVTLLCESYFENLKLTPAQISEIYSAGDVTPGDFGALNGKLRFLPKEKKTAQYVTEALCKIVREKTRSFENKKIGFGA